MPRRRSDNHMLWKTIDNLTSKELPRRGAELRQRLESFSDQDLVLFQNQAVEVFRLLFTSRTYYLYSAAFDGETNGSGLTDFCSNLMLSGHSLVDSVLRSPDNFADVTNTEPFNEDNGISVCSIARHILVERYDEDVTEDMFQRGGVQSLDGIWKELENQVGKLTFEPDWRVVEATMPRIFAKMRRR